jgi:hypothetical protein
MVAEPFEHASRAVRERLAPIVERVVARHRDAPVPLREPGNPMGVWFTIPDAETGAPLALVSAHASAVTFLLGKRGFLHSRDTATLTGAALERWFEDILDGVLGGGLSIDGDRATLTTRQGEIDLAA